MTGQGTILFVDDEEDVTKIGQKLLESLSYQVITAGSGLEALEIFSEAPESFDLLITDQTMPRFTGLDLAKAVLKIQADLPIILMTVYSDMATPEQATQLGIRAYVLKPFDINALNQTIQEILV